MRSYFITQKELSTSVFFLLMLTVSGICQQTNLASTVPNTQDARQPSIDIYYDTQEPAINFAARDLKRILINQRTTTALKPLSELAAKPAGTYIVIARDDADILTKLLAAGSQAVSDMGEQEYALRVTGSANTTGYWAIGGDRVGAMYGGIHLAEIAAGGSLADVKDEDQSPYIAKRGLKFNIPLDIRQPSHGEKWNEATSAQSNIINVWDWDFWQAYLDVLARQRYNVLSLWNKHPFPSMVKLDNYPNIALDDVYNKDGKLRDMTIDEKIELWQRIMDYAWDRGIEVYIVTWNIHINGTDGQYGLSTDPDDNATKDYMRECVKQLFLTYPRLAGIGTTAGENGMWDMSGDEKEEWLWAAYGRGIMDVKQNQPDRHIRFIHRYWQTAFNKIEDRFGALPDGYDMSFKYIKARLYSLPTSRFADNELVNKMPKGMVSWWNLRNDDIYNMRWGDPEYVKQFILSFPKEVTAGYYMGSDRYAWARESISKNPLTPRQLENEKHWYSFLLWGRLGYDPNTPASLLKGLIKYRFPTASADDLYDAWQEASRTIPLVNQIHWENWDYKWWVEACVSSGVGSAIDGYHDINDFINQATMPGSDVTSISSFAGGNHSGTSPLEVASQIETHAQNALTKIARVSNGGNMELKETIGDIKAQAYLGLYYAKKIRGAVDLSRYRQGKGRQYRKSAVSHLEQSLAEWKHYAGVLGSQYEKMVLGFNGLFDWDALEKDVENDIEIARRENE
ncbi:hypothetical protein ACFL6U_26265 [Planctomycetota bacterium]